MPVCDCHSARARKGELAAGTPHGTCTTERGGPVTQLSASSVPDAGMAVQANNMGVAVGARAAVGTAKCMVLATSALVVLAIMWTPTSVSVAATLAMSLPPTACVVGFATTTAAAATLARDVVEGTAAACVVAVGAAAHLLCYCPWRGGWHIGVR